ncbi:DUF1176 domain-containing protein [Sphingorhabdus contaminans]|uniref:DUF1176 domain-containing protein n=1 Tax=Sphingorhabdus contaminans TaxID=1343899 RepID=A0A553WCH0_9SPHN|nr:DUF1176 domain-containing protein [Sphingorhabdus contaminans]TSB02383.1 hypothetical protein FOM92_14910 [Sphingorhabdus contaminans]
MLSSALVVSAVSFLSPTAYAKSLHPDFQLMRGGVQQYGDWLVGCDNNAECTMIGFPKRAIMRELDVASKEMAVQISLSGSDDAAPVVELVPFGVDIAGKATAYSSGRFVLNVEYEVAAISIPHGFSRQALLPMEAAAVVKHLQGNKRLTGKALSNNTVIVRFPEAEFNRAFTTMQSRRAQLLKIRADQAIDDLPGELPDGSTMPVAGKLKRIVARETIVSGFVPILAEGRCKNDFMANPRQFHFANGAILWSFECTMAGGLTRTHWDMAPSAVALSAPVDLPEPRDGKVRAGIDGLDGVAFDWDFGILRSYQYLDGREDCGTFRAWGFTASGWQLLERREMPLCKGIASDQWIRTYYLPTEGGGPDE